MIKKLFFSVAVAFLIVQHSQGQTWKELLDQADKFNSQRKIDSAIAFGNMALEKARHDNGEIDTSIALVFHRLGAYHHAIKAANEDSFYLAALSVWNKIPTANPMTVAKTLNNLGTFYSDVGKIKLAEYYHKRTIALKEKYGTSNDELSLAVSYHNLGGFYRGVGKFDLAEDYLKRALSIRERKLTLSNPLTANTINVLGVLYQEVGNYEKAEELYYLALSAQMKSAQDTIFRVGYLANLGNLFLEEAKYASADTFFTQALAIQQNPRYFDAEIRLEILNDLSQVHSNQGSFEQAGKELDEAMQLLGSVRNVKPIFESLTLSNMGKVALHRGNVAQAESLFQRSLGIRRNFLGDRNSTVANNIADLAVSYRSQGKLGSSMEYARQALQTQDRVLDMLSQTMSEKDVLAYIESHRIAVGIYLSSFIDSLQRHDINCIDAAQVVLQNKGVLAERMFQRQQSLLNEQDSSAQALLEDYRDVQYQLSRLFAQGSEVESSPQRKRVEDSLSRRFDDLESAIAHKNQASGSLHRERSLSLNSITASIPANGTLIEYMKYDYYPLNQHAPMPHYLALVAKRDGKCWVKDLGDAEAIDIEILEYRNHFTKLSHENQVTPEDQREYESIAKNLSHRIWEPIAEEVGGTGIVFIGADAGLNLVSFSGLIGDDGRYLIEEYPIHYVSAGRDLVEKTIGEKAGKGIVAFGDPDFNASASMRKGNNAAQQISSTPEQGEINRVLNVRSNCDALSTMTILPLPGTRSEINELVKSYDNEPPLLFLGAVASEENFKLASPHHRYIHVATHGYFLGGECNAETKPSQEVKRKLVKENPLLQSGILLAGANLHGADADAYGAEDGILTALEVSGMDLRGTDLVVLSACETGLGKIEQGEGVYGLRRSFQMAGARTVVSSLWQIPDNETREYMKELYSLQSPTYPELLQKISLRRLNELKKRGRVTHPFTWAGFVATGDWVIK